MRAERIARLQAMGVQLWLPRQAVSQIPPTAVSAGSAASLRVRVSAGTGDWLLVTRRQPAERWSRLVEDITCAIGRERCLFGRWADNEAAGAALEEVGSRGIRWVLSLGKPPVLSEFPGLLIAADLETLARDADARRALWELIEGPLSGAGSG